jgi:hypothetical protein
MRYKLSKSGLGLECLTPLSTVFQLYHAMIVVSFSFVFFGGENHRPVASH